VGVASPVPLEVYLSTSYDPERKYVDGRLVERKVGELDHSYLQYVIARAFDRAGLSFVGLRVQVAATRFRIPDVLAVRDMPHQRYLRQPPYIVVEILSREDRVSAGQQ
jgi:Uma2 family endonuclease